MEYRQFVVSQWSKTQPFVVVWCKAKICNSCLIRFECFTTREIFVIDSKLSAFIFHDTVIPFFKPEREDGGFEPLSVVNVIERLIAGLVTVPTNKWNNDLAIQARLRCPKSFLYCDCCRLDYCQGKQEKF